MNLFIDKANCCGCEACANVCAKSAISMKEDEYGYKYPKIDPEKCVNCGLCIKVCAFQNIAEVNKPQSVYVATSRNKQQIQKSASGGIFAAIATYVISKGGIVYGAYLSVKNGVFNVEHIGVEKKEDICKIQGSKYVQSAINQCFSNVRKQLKSGRLVLFSGTPCQCAGLKAFLQKKYSNLIIIDIICHGVPNLTLFNKYIQYNFPTEFSYSSFLFRDKSKGWGLSAKLCYDSGKSKNIPAGTSSYYSLFLDSQIYRESCYKCKYASQHRPGDITIGDYWGIQKEHPELLKSGKYILKDGVSCIIINTVEGEKLIKNLDEYIIYDKSSYDKVARRNAQLIAPSKKGKFHDTILNIFKFEGYRGVEYFFRQHYKRQIIIHFMFSRLPFGIKEIIRNIIH